MKTYEGDSQLKHSKADLFIQEYNSFVMLDDESIYGMFKRFNGVINNLKSLGITYTNEAYMKKFLSGIPSGSSEMKNIEEQRNHYVFSLEDIVERLKVHDQKPLLT